MDFSIGIWNREIARSSFQEPFGSLPRVATGLYMSIQCSTIPQHDVTTLHVFSFASKVIMGIILSLEPLKCIGGGRVCR